MSPWWLRPPADEPVDDERPKGPEKIRDSGHEAPSIGATEESRDQGPTGKVPPGSSPPGASGQDRQRTPRRRPQRGQGRRSGRESGEESAAPATSRPRRRGRRSSPASKNSGADTKVAASHGSSKEPGLAARSQDRPTLENRRLAVICDLESAALGMRESGVGQFDVDLVLERLLDKGKIVVKRAYADWDRHREIKRSFHQAGVELIEIPPTQHSGTSGAGIRIAVDTMELCYSKQHLDTFVLISGNGDLTPLVANLEANNKHVIGVGSSNSASKLLIDNCDEYLFYEDLRRKAEVPPVLGDVDESRAEAFTLLVEAIQALMRENQQTLWGSVVKQAIQRKHPSFSESHHGYSTFSKMLEAAEAAGIIKLRKDQRSGSYVVTEFVQS